MKIRLMLVKDSRPVAHAEVRFPELDGGECRTDEEGRVEVDIPQGAHTVEVRQGEQWTPHPVHADVRSSLIVVDIGARQSALDAQATKDYLDFGDNEIGERYRVTKLLGRGGMGVVVEADDTLLGRKVAIKMLNDQLHDNPEAERIFLTEARAMAKLSHPNLVAVHDVIAGDRRTLMVVEFIDGRSLESVIMERGGLPEPTVLTVGVALCRGFAYLHSQGVIHRDLKPANVMLQTDGTLKLIDFGLARSLEHIAMRGTNVRGTPAYMAPEQVLGGELSAATDIYQIGVTLFEAVTGRLPFETGQIAYAHVHNEPPRVDELGVDVSPGLAQLIHACIAEPCRTPAQRGLRPRATAGVGGRRRHHRSVDRDVAWRGAYAPRVVGLAADADRLVGADRRQQAQIPQRRHRHRAAGGRHRDRRCGGVAPGLREEAVVAADQAVGRQRQGHRSTPRARGRADGQTAGARRGDPVAEAGRSPGCRQSHRRGDRGRTRGHRSRGGPREKAGRGQTVVGAQGPEVGARACEIRRPRGGVPHLRSRRLRGHQDTARKDRTRKDRTRKDRTRKDRTRKDRTRNRTRRPDQDDRTSPRSTRSSVLRTWSLPLSSTASRRPRQSACRRWPSNPRHSPRTAPRTPPPRRRRSPHQSRMTTNPTRRSPPRRRKRCPRLRLASSAAMSV